MIPESKVQHSAGTAWSSGDEKTIGTSVFSVLERVTRVSELWILEKCAHREV